jgi:hypothetical protein
MLVVIEARGEEEARTEEVWAVRPWLMARKPPVATRMRMETSATHPAA